MTTATVALEGRYRLREEITRGEAGVVWAAYDELLQREVAVKEIPIPPDLRPAQRRRLVERALGEARTAAAIDTTAAVRVFDVVVHDGRPWVVMEVVPGPTLRQVLTTDRSLPSVRLARVGLAVLEATEVAHRVGVAHCTVTPDNVIIGSDGRIALSDFCVHAVGHEPGECGGDLRALGETLRAALGRQADRGLRRLVDELTSASPADLPAPAEVRARLEQVVRAAHADRPPPWPLSAADPADDEAPVWPLLATFLALLVATAVVLTVVLQQGA